MGGWGYAAAVLAIIGNVLIIYRRRSGFILFFISDLIWIFYHWGDTPSVVQFCIFLVLAGWGIWRWTERAVKKVSA